MSRAIAVLLALPAILLLPPGHAAAAAPCTGDPTQVRGITLTVDGEPSTGRYAVPAARPRGLVVLAHGAANTSDAWRGHMTRLAQRDGVVAVAMDYRGMQVTGRHETRGTETARGFPARKGAEDLVAAARHFDSECPGLPGIVLYGVSMGGSMSGLAAAAGAERADGRPLFDYWLATEGVHNFTESYLEARAVAFYVKFAATIREDMEAEAGGPIETQAPEYFRRTNINRVPDIAASGLRGVVLVHAYEDGIVPYNQSLEMSQALRGAGVPTDLYSVGRREPGDGSHDTIGKYGGATTGNAGHGWEGSDTHVVVQSGLDRLSALITRGEPAPCNRDFRIDEQPSNVTPDPREAPAGCEPDPFPASGAACRDTAAPARPSMRVRRRGGRLVVKGRATDRGCGRIRRVLVAVARRGESGRCHYLARSGRLGPRRSCARPVYRRAAGRETWRLHTRRPARRGRYVVRAVAVDAGGRRSRAARGRFRIR